LQTFDHTQKRDEERQEERDAHGNSISLELLCTRRTPPSLAGSSTPRSPPTATAPTHRQQRHTLLLHTAALLLYISSGICTAMDSAALQNYGTIQARHCSTATYYVATHTATTTAHTLYSTQSSNMWREERNRQSERRESGRQPIRERERAQDREEEEEVTLPSGVWLLAFGFWLLASGTFTVSDCYCTSHWRRRRHTYAWVRVAGRNGAYPTTVDSMRLVCTTRQTDIGHCKRCRPNIFTRQKNYIYN